MDYYGWIWFYGLSMWKICKFTADGEDFTVCGNADVYRVVDRDFQGKANIIKKDLLPSDCRSSIHFGDIVDNPPYIN